MKKTLLLTLSFLVAGNTLMVSQAHAGLWDSIKNAATVSYNYVQPAVKYAKPAVKLGAASGLAVLAACHARNIARCWMSDSMNLLLCKQFPNFDYAWEGCLLNSTSTAIAATTAASLLFNSACNDINEINKQA